MHRALIRITTLAVALVWIGCGSSAKKVRKAQTSGYDADFAIVFSETLAAVQDIYPHLDENPSAGWIKTAWHPIRINQEGATGETTQVVGAGGPMGATPGSLGGSTTALRRHYFVRFRVYVLGGRPWRVRVEGEASEYETGQAQPVALTGAAVPGWLKGRTEALQVAIYDRLQQHAVPLEKKHQRDVEPQQPRAVAADAYGALPAPATEYIDQVHAALLAGNYGRLRQLIADDFTWAPGAPPNADQAIVMWKADPTLASRLVQVLEAGCAVTEAGQAIQCPADYDPNRADNELEGFHARFEKTADGWAMTSFLSED